MNKNSFEISVLVNGKPLREYFHNGHFYVEGRGNSDFELLLRNNSYRRVEAVVSVDGLDVLDGKTANSKKTGYLVNAYSTVKISGWRLNTDEVAKFVFAAQEESYAASKNKPRNIGVIGVAFFNEKIHYQPWFSNTNFQFTPCADSTGYFPKGLRNHSVSVGDTKCSGRGSSVGGGSTVNVSNSVGTQGLGTGFGQKTESRVYNVSFERASEKPDEILKLYYNDRKGLEEIGIKVAQPLSEDTARRETAQPFEDVSDGCEPPPNWRG